MRIRVGLGAPEEIEEEELMTSIDRIKRFVYGGVIPPPTFAERALLMSNAHKTFVEHARQLEADIASKRADIDAAHARLSALQQKGTAT